MWPTVLLKVFLELHVHPLSPFNQFDDGGILYPLITKQLAVCAA